MKKEEKGEAYYKQEKIKSEWIRLVGEDNFGGLRLDDFGYSDWHCRKLMPQSYWAALSDVIRSGLKKQPSGSDIFYRPKSLKGIETNNGWHSIFTVDDYPKIAGNYLFLVDGRNVEQWYEDGVRFAKSHTHLREIQTIPQPLY